MTVTYLRFCKGGMASESDPIRASEGFAPSGV